MQPIALGCLILLSLMLSLTVFIGSPSNKASAAVADDFQVSVMGPLAKINDWSSFKKQLQILKSSGVYAIQKFKDADLDLTFTALEMNDSGTAPNYSLPSTLVDTISSIAKAKGVRLNDENALPTGGGTGNKVR